MTQLALELPDNIFSSLRMSPAAFVREMRIAAAVQWYAEQRISQEKAAEIAGQSRTTFIDELHRRNVAAIQLDAAELDAELGNA
jgi:predicted HTH domain antitoxin